MHDNESKTILLVEDNDNDAELTIRALKRVDMDDQVLRFINGRDSLNYLVNHVNEKFPNLILLDIKLPGMDGLEVLREIKSNPKLACIPVVMLTSSTVQEDVITSYQYGANSFISKPVEYDRFSEVIQVVASYWTRVNKGVLMSQAKEPKE